jgi:transcriptional regulator with XRE-family HTH domain
VLFGKQVRALREERKLSQEKLAELCHVHRNYPGRVERAEVNIRFDYILALARGLEVKPAELFKLIPVPNAASRLAKTKKKTA